MALIDPADVEAVAEAIYTAFPYATGRSEDVPWGRKPWPDAAAYWKEACVAEAKAAIAALIERGWKKEP